MIADDTTSTALDRDAADEVIAGGTTPLVGGGEGVRVLALANAALESFRTGRAVGI